MLHPLKKRKPHKMINRTEDNVVDIDLVDNHTTEKVLKKHG